MKRQASLLQHAPMLSTFTATKQANDACTTSGTTSSKEPQFSDTTSLFKGQSTGALLRSWAVFMACSQPWFVKHADSLLTVSKRVIGTQATMGIIKASFFKQFCAGETQQQVETVMEQLHTRGIGGILDYAAEDDVVPVAATPVAATKASRGAPPVPGSCGDQKVGVDVSDLKTTLTARSYPYASERACDAHVQSFLSAIRAAAMAPGQGFAVVKLSACGNPLLLERMSWAIKQGCETYRFAHVSLTEEEADDGHSEFRGGRAMVTAMRNRLHTLAEASAQDGVKLMIDAEQTYLQPAIDHLAQDMMRIFNRDPKKIRSRGLKGAVMFNTYQCYRKGTEERLTHDLETAKRDGYVLGVKLVRGAYLEMERARAQRMNYPDPIHDTLQDTHDEYARCTEMLLEAVAKGEAEVLLGTHNQQSIVLAMATMERLKLTSKSPVYFAQLLGMADHLTQALGAAGFQSYKYLPFGHVQQVVPYLLRRAHENASIMQGSKQDVVLIKTELKRRARAMLGRS